METVAIAIAAAFCFYCACAVVNHVAVERIRHKHGRRGTRPTIRTVLDEGAFLPIRAHDTDAGADLRTPVEVRVPPHDSALVHTGTHIQLPPGTCGLVVSKSGLMIFNALTSTGLIDEGFTGEIILRVFNNGPDWYTFRAGDSVSQVAVIPVLYPTYELADELRGGDRGDNGYGSTGR